MAVENLSMILSLAAVHLAAVITPGANFLLVSTHALNYTRRVGVFTAWGVTTSTLCFVTVGFLGFAVIIARSALAFNVMKVVGAAYFVYMGVGLLRSALRTTRPTASAVTQAITERRAYSAGVATGLANPASALYFLSLFTTFIAPETPLNLKLLMALMLIAMSATWYMLVVLFFSHTQVQRVYGRLRPIINAVFGVLWLGLAVRLLRAEL